MSDVVTYSGIIPPLITPLTADGKVDTGALGRLVEHLISNGVSGLFVLGTSGEGPWLTAAQRLEVMQTAVISSRNRVPVLAGVLDPGPGSVVESARLASACGVHALVVTTPYYFQADATAQLRHFDQVLDQVDLPVMLYNIPGMTHNVLTPDIASKLAEHPRVIGIKDSAGDWDAFQSFLQIRDHNDQFVVFQGAEKLAAKSLQHGANGAVPGLGNIAPSLFAQLAEAVQAGEFDIANDLDARIQQLWELHNVGYWLTCLKYAGAHLGFGSGATVSANPELSDSARSTIEHLIDSTIAA